MLNKKILIKNEEIFLSWKDLFIIFMISPLLNVIFYYSGITKQLNLLITSIISLLCTTGYIIVFSIIKDVKAKKTNAFKKTLKNLHLLFIKMENTCDVKDYVVFKESVIKSIPNNIEEKQMIKNIANMDNADFSLSIKKVLSSLFESLLTAFLYAIFALVFALSNSNLDDFTLFSFNSDIIFVLIFILTFFQKIFENNVEKNKLFKKQDTNSIKRMCNMIIEILEKDTYGTKKRNTVRIRKIYSKKYSKIRIKNLQLKNIKA